ncbi:MAG: peptide-methionine (S)-S-oxide reductase, partial [Flavobacteriales bacterium]
NRQGADVGTQYRSAVFYHNEEQGKLAKDFKKRLNDEKAFGKPVVTEISAATEFYAAEEYHQDYFENNPTNSYCRMVVGPKLEKFRKVFKQPVVN